MPTTTVLMILYGLIDILWVDHFAPSGMDFSAFLPGIRLWRTNVHAYHVGIYKTVLSLATAAHLLFHQLHPKK